MNTDPLNGSIAIAQTDNSALHSGATEVALGLQQRSYLLMQLPMIVST